MELNYLNELTDAFNRRDESPDGIARFLELAERAEVEIEDGTGNPLMMSLLAGQIRRGSYEDSVERKNMTEQVIGIFEEHYLNFSQYPSLSNS